MRGRSVATRILGVAAAVRGFAYALTEGPGCLVDVNIRRQPAASADMVKILSAVIARAQPLFVAIEATKSKRGSRASVLDTQLTEACANADVMILRITAEQLKALTELDKPTRWELAKEIARRYPEIAHRLPRKREIWEAEDERIGMFHALAAALAAWRMFHPVPTDDS